MRIHNSDFRRQAHIAKRMLTSRAGTAIISSQINNIGIRFGNAYSNNANARHHRSLYSNPRFGIDRFEFFDKLSEILNRVNIVVVGRGDQVDASLESAVLLDRVDRGWGGVSMKLSAISSQLSALSRQLIAIS